MVNAITLIEKFLIDNGTRPMKRWSTRFNRNPDSRLNWHTKTLIKKIRYVLEIVSGNDVINMMKGSYFSLSF